MNIPTQLTIAADKFNPLFALCKWINDRPACLDLPDRMFEVVIDKKIDLIEDTSDEMKTIIESDVMSILSVDIDDDGMFALILDDREDESKEVTVRIWCQA